jgi:hypothetical protein
VAIQFRSFTGGDAVVFSANDEQMLVLTGSPATSGTWAHKAGSFGSDRSLRLLDGDAVALPIDAAAGAAEQVAFAFRFDSLGALELLLTDATDPNATVRIGADGLIRIYRGDSDAGTLLATSADPLVEGAAYWLLATLTLTDTGRITVVVLDDETHDEAASADTGPGVDCSALGDDHWISTWLVASAGCDVYIADLVRAPAGTLDPDDEPWYVPVKLAISDVVGVSTPSTGGNRWAVIDEIPASTTDGTVFAEVDDEDRYGLSALPVEPGAVAALRVVAYATMSGGDEDEVDCCRVGLRLGATTERSDDLAAGLGPEYLAVHGTFPLDPDGQPWTGESAAVLVSATFQAGSTTGAGEGGGGGDGGDVTLAWLAVEVLATAPSEGESSSCGPWLEQEPQGAEWRWLIELEFAGRTWLWSDLSCEVESLDGTVRRYDEALTDIRWERSIDIGNDSGGEMEIPISALAPDGVDVAEIIEQGHELPGARCTILRWREGSYYDDARRLLVGVVREPRVGAADEEVEFSVASTFGLGEPDAQVAEWPDPRAKITAHTFPSHDQGTGEYYPRVFGTPGHDGTPATRAFCIGGVGGTDDELFLIADGPVLAVEVTIIDGANGDTAVLAVLEVTDADGRVVSIVQNDGGLTYDSTHEYFVSWTEGGGIPDPETGAALQSAGALLRYLYDQRRVVFDRGRFKAVEALLSGWIIAGYVDEPCDPLDLAQNVILTLLPVSIVVGPEGPYPVVWKLDARTEDAVRDWSVERGDIDRDGPQEYGPAEDVVNSVVVNFSRNVKTGTFSAAFSTEGSSAIALPPLPGPGVTNAQAAAWAKAARAATSKETRKSAIIHGPAEATRDVEWVDSRATAGKIAAVQLLASAAVTRHLHYDLREIDPTLELGAVVLVSEDGLHLDQRVCLVVGITEDGQGMGVTVRVLTR